MEYLIVCYSNVLNRDVRTLKATNFEEALNLYYDECYKEEYFINVMLYEGNIKIGSYFMGNEEMKPIIQ